MTIYCYKIIFIHYSYAILPLLLNECRRHHHHYNMDDDEMRPIKLIEHTHVVRD